LLTPQPTAYAVAKALAAVRASYSAPYRYTFHLRPRRPWLGALDAGFTVADVGPSEQAGERLARATAVGVAPL
jgi:hypothetical protein